MKVYVVIERKHFNTFKEEVEPRIISINSTMQSAARSINDSKKKIIDYIIDCGGDSCDIKQHDSGLKYITGTDEEHWIWHIEEHEVKEV